MAEFRDIIGQEQLKEHLQGAIERNKVSHAYIINGERNSGKEFIAKVFCNGIGMYGQEGWRTLSGMSFLQTGIKRESSGYYFCIP